MKKLRYIIEAILLYASFTFFKCLPAQTASSIGGWLGKTIGPKLAASRKAKKNIQHALPEKTEKQQNIIIRGMWENLGRVIAEYPHLEKISRNHAHVNNKELLFHYIHSNTAIVFIGGHLANWEMNAPTMLTQFDKSIKLTYRAPNNPYVNKLLEHLRSLNGKIKGYPKARESGKLIMQSIKNNDLLGILIDQKYNEGIEAQFFSRPAMTNPIFVQLAQKYNCPIIPVRVERIKGCKFNLTPHPAIPTHDKSGQKRPILDVINDANNLLESWIRERPEQWLWLHRRWKD